MRVASPVASAHISSSMKCPTNNKPGVDKYCSWHQHSCQRWIIHCNVMLLGKTVEKEKSFMSACRRFRQAAPPRIHSRLLISTKAVRSLPAFLIPLAEQSFHQLGSSLHRKTSVTLDRLAFRKRLTIKAWNRCPSRRHVLCNNSVRFQSLNS